MNFLSPYTAPFYLETFRFPLCFAERYSVVDVAFNPEVLETTEKEKHEKEQLHLLAVNFIQQQHNLSLSQRYKLTKDKIKGSIQDMKQRLMSPRTSECSANKPQSEPGKMHVL